MTAYSASSSDRIFHHNAFKAPFKCLYQLLCFGHKSIGSTAYLCQLPHKLCWSNKIYPVELYSHLVVSPGPPLTRLAPHLPCLVLWNTTPHDEHSSPLKKHINRLTYQTSITDILQCTVRQPSHQDWRQNIRYTNNRYISMYSDIGTLHKWQTMSIWLISGHISNGQLVFANSNLNL